MVCAKCGIYCFGRVCGRCSGEAPRATTSYAQVARDEFRADAARTLRRAAKEGPITIVDDQGRARGVVAVPMDDDAELPSEQEPARAELVLLLRSAKKLLRDRQWYGLDGSGWCETCESHHDRGHRPNCEVARVLNAIGEVDNEREG